MERRPRFSARAPSSARIGSYGAVSQRIALLGALAGVDDQVRAKQLELNAASLSGVGVSKSQADAILLVTRAQAEMSRVSEQASIGVFSLRDASKAAGDTLQSLVDRDLLDPKNAEQWAAANNHAARSLEDLSDQAKVAGSALPQLQAALNDTNSARKQLDSLATEAMSVNRGLFVEFGQQLRSGAGAWQAFASAGLNALGKLADKLMSMAADNLFANAFGGSTGGLASLFGLGGGGAAGSGSVPTWSGADLGAGTGGLSIPMFASGTNSAPGGLAKINEKGGEIVNLPRGAQVIPHDVSMAMARGSGSVNAPVTINIDATGADAAGLARVEGQLRQLKAELPSQIVSTVKTAKKGRVL